MFSHPVRFDGVASPRLEAAFSAVKSGLSEIVLRESLLLLWDAQILLLLLHFGNIYFAGHLHMGGASMLRGRIFIHRDGLVTASISRRPGLCGE